MKFQSRVLGIAVVLALAIPAGARQAATGQEIISEAGIRKIRTRVVPEYPQLARQLNVTGKVKIEVTISTDGHVTNTRTVGGSPLLVASVTDAVKKWRYEPAPKESTEIVEVNFSGKN